MEIETIPISIYLSPLTRVTQYDDYFDFPLDRGFIFNQAEKTEGYQFEVKSVRLLNLWGAYYFFFSGFRIKTRYWY